METFEVSSEDQHIEKRKEGMLKEKKVCEEPTSDDILPLESSSRRRKIEKEYLRGISFILLTVGLMAVVLVLALDDYIISGFEAIPPSTSEKEADIRSDGHTNSDHPFQ